MNGWSSRKLKDAGVSLIDCVHKTPSEQPDGYPYVGIPQMNQTPSLPVPDPANDATREKQIPFRWAAALHFFPDSFGRRSGFSRRPYLEKKHLR